MKSSAPLRGHVAPAEKGYALLAVIFLMVLLVLALSVAVPRMSREIQRDREVETVERGKQYERAIQLYYRKFHAYPPSVDALVKTNEIRFLRKKYTDPMTGKDDWKPILFGQNKVPTVMGFFGQTLATGSSIAGIGPAGGNGINGASAPGTSIFSTSGAGSTSSTTPGTTDNGSGTAAANGTTAGAGTGSGTSGPTSGQTFGGAGIIGFSPGADRESILTYKTKNRYDEWEFTYDPAMDMPKISGGNTGAIGQPAGSTTNPVGANPFGTTTNGSSSGTATAPNSPPETTAPQQ